MSTPDHAMHLLSEPQEALVFWRLRLRTIATVFRQAVAESRLRITLVVGLSGLFWVALFLLFAEGFQFLETSVRNPAMHLQMVRGVYSVFFGSLMAMLVFSSGVIVYSGLYRSPEVAFLLTMPARTERIFLHKFQEAIFFSSWGFLLLGSPVLVAYGVVAGAAWYYYAMLVPFMLAFVYIPGGIGAILCLAIVHWLPTNRNRVLGIAAVAGTVVVAWVGWSLASGPESDLLTPTWFQEMLGRLRYTEGRLRLLPSWWLSSGLLETAHGNWTQGLLFLGVTVSNALVTRLASIWAAGRIYRPGYSALYGLPTLHKRTRTAWIDRFISRWALFLSPPMRLLIVKDLRLFRRDPVQWSQFLIFFGLLGLYFTNIRRFGYGVNYAAWVNMISFLNLAVVGLILSTFTTRFIFPMISLEGRQFWILSPLPVKRDTILWGKFLFASAGSIVPSTLLIMVSDVMLRVSGLVIAVHQLTCVMLCVGLSGIAVGLGAKIPNLREQSPSRIAAGFGGTLNLVLSAIYIVAIVALTALPCHFYLVVEQTGIGGALVQPADARFWLGAGIAGSLVLGLVATFVPLWIGLLAFRKLEF